MNINAKNQFVFLKSLAKLIILTDGILLGNFNKIMRVGILNLTKTKPTQLYCPIILINIIN